MDEFHWLRPLWLLALPAVLAAVVWMCRRAAAAGAWRRVVDRELEPHVLVASQRSVSRWLPPLVAGIASTLAVLALAGPAFERVAVPTMRSSDALVVAFDLSRSMDATDVEPSRLARSKLKLLSLLDGRSGSETALVVFSAHAFTVTPLTNDSRTVASLVKSLSTDIMPSQGSRLAVGLDKAASLLRQAGHGRGEILLISDADVDDEALDLVRALGRDGIDVSVMAVGTREGAPIPRREGGFLTDDGGQVVVPGVNLSGLRELARAGGGRFAQLAPDDSDLAALFPDRLRPTGVVERASEDGSEEHEADVWREDGVWLTLALLPLVALAFRRGWIAVAALVFVVPLPRAEALEWDSLWLREDQRGVRALREDDPAAAAELFEDRDWRGVAEYRAGDFASSAATLEGIDTADAHYNRGTALARAGELQAALDALERSLELDPDDADARYNRDLVADLLEQQQQSEQQQEQQPQNGETQSAADEAGAEAGNEQSGQSDESASPQPSERSLADSGQDDEAQESRSGQSAEQSAGEPGDSSSDPAEGDEQALAESQAQQEQADGEPEEMTASLAGDELEQWESEQAADQWLRRVQQDPGGLLRRKFLYQYQRLGVDQDGNYVWPEDGTEAW